MSSLADASGTEDRLNPAKKRTRRRAHVLPYALALPIVLYEIALVVYPIAQGIYGNVDVLKAMLIGLPAVGGAVAGTALQQRVPTRAISGAFAVLLVVSAVVLVV